MGGILSAGASLLGAKMGADAASDAADSYGRATDRSIDEQRRQFDISRADTMPWLNTGRAANSQLAYLAGITPEGMTQDALASSVNPQLGGYGSLMQRYSGQDIYTDPSYQFRLQEGQKALERSASAKGRTFSGSTMKALQDYGQNAASQEYQNAYNRYTNDQNSIWNKLAGLSGAGQQQAQNLGQLGQNYSNNVSSLMTNNAQIQGAAGIAGAKAWGTGLGAAAGALSSPGGFGYQQPGIFAGY